MTVDPLLSDDIYTLLQKFPSDALKQIVCIYKNRASWSPFPAGRAYRVHDLPSGADFTPYAEEIARELIWWGSNEFHRQFGELPNYREIVCGVAKKMGVEEKNRADALPVWRIEQETLKKFLEDLEKLSPADREKKLKEASGSLSPAWGASATALSGALSWGAEAFLSFLARQVSATAVTAAGATAAVVTPLAIVAAVLWTAYDLAEPGYRVLGPAVLTVALTRQKLRESRAGAAFED